ncbi:hypothetical protein PTSG_05094 [Salpingoeca rosetta]|uniref:Nucleolar complex protein 3 homolog n=1 Tax=Salpingoeca rosetta (strain ATCC 50818 / BSB-021) TaxID=946362 RepID=F2UAI3_SALR5|nr:uncharacterized protein PTSG_05094 [Salpingoeca rosetta]EGD73399.1 hypothetical protein PTSG_05094 [Salpingoeca rosetta]|eukprot:XP_004993681.1 hypothetical protein PTSG_05094 [Salpingoeca rosetta]
MSEDGDLESLIGNSRTLQSFTSAALETEHEDSGDGKPLSRRQRRLRQRERANLEASLKQEELVRAARQQERADEEDAAGPAPLPIKVRNKITLPKATPKSELRSLPSDSKDTKDDDQDERTGPRTKRSKSAAASGGDDEDDAALMEMAAADSAPLPPTALLALRKEEIASACSAVLEAPETHITKLGSIIDLCRSNDAAIKFAVRKLAIASLTAVFRDIIPGYHIRQLTEKEQTQRMTKEVKQVREYEGSLLKMYQAFLQHLHTCIKDLRESRKAYVKKHGPKMPASIAREEKDLKRVASLALLAAQSLCQLLETAPHFNFRNNIITVITPLMTGKLGSHLSRVTTSCAIDVFKADQAYDVSLSLAKAIAQEIKTSAYNVDPQMVGCFRFLKIQERHIKAKKRDAEQDVKQRHEDRYSKKRGKRGKKEAQNKGTRRERKELKAEKELSKELMATEKEANTKKLEHNQTQILKVVFAVYFRVLKHAQQSRTLPTVLEGIAHFAHLIDVAVFFDLLEVLKEVIASGSLSLPARMTAISAAMTLVAEEHSLTAVDPTSFLKELFVHIPATMLHPDLFKHVLACTNLLLVRRKEVSVDRVAGLVKQLLDVCLHLPHHCVVATQALVRDVVRKYPRVAPMLENDTVASGVYNPRAVLPEHSNALATALWEGALFASHYHPIARMFNTNIVHGAPLTGNARLPPEHVKRTYRDYLAEMSPNDKDWPFMPSMQSLYRRPRLVHTKKPKEICPHVQLAVEEVEAFDFDRALKLGSVVPRGEHSSGAAQQVEGTSPAKADHHGTGKGKGKKTRRKRRGGAKNKKAMKDGARAATARRPGTRDVGGSSRSNGVQGQRKKNKATRHQGGRL